MRFENNAGGRGRRDPKGGPGESGGQGGGQSRESYHHGNLREALIEAALGLIAEHGAAGFSFAQAARAAGVSTAAPYRHFRDLQALIAEIARRGYERFAQDLEAAWQDGQPDPLAALGRCGDAYLGFARRNPAFYAAMFEPGFSFQASAELLAVSERAFNALRRAAEAVCASLPKDRRAPGLMVALHIWSLSHGIASLFVGRAASSRRTIPMTAEQLLEAGVLVYLQGLGVSAADKP